MEVGAVEKPADDCDEQAFPYEWPWVAVDEDRETQDIDPLPPLLYVAEGPRPILAKEGEDDILCKVWRRRLLPLSFGGCSNGRGSDSACELIGPMAPGSSVILS